MIDIEIVDNFLTNKYFLNLKNIVLSDAVQWQLQLPLTEYGGMLSPEAIYEKELMGCMTWNHTVYYQNNIHSILFHTFAGFYGSIQEKYNIGNIIKSRLDLTTFNPQQYKHVNHIDINNQENVTTLLYFTTSSAPTVLYNTQVNYNDINNRKYTEIKKIIYPKENRLLIFNGKYLHSGYSPHEENIRVLLNTNFYLENK